MDAETEAGQSVITLQYNPDSCRKKRLQLKADAPKATAEIGTSAPSIVRQVLRRLAIRWTPPACTP